MINNLLEKFKNKLLADDSKENTVKNYISDIRNFYKWYKEINCSQNIQDVSSHHLNAYKEFLIHSLRKKTSSINRNIQSIKNFFLFLLKQKFIKTNPSVKIKFLRKQKKVQPKALSKRDIHKLLSLTAYSAHGTKKRNYAIIQVLLQTGIRVGELINLEIRDLKIYDRSGELRVIDAKGGKERIIPLNNTARKALKNYFEGKNLDERNKVFLSKQNKAMSSRAVQKLISNLARKADVANVTPHTLRHTFAINYLRSNPDCLLELSTLLGHESLDTTSIYTVASKERLAETIETVGAYINE